MVIWSSIIVCSCLVDQEIIVDFNGNVHCIPDTHFRGERVL